MGSNFRYYSVLDKAIAQCHVFLEILFSRLKAKRANPARNLDERLPLRPDEKKKSVGFMRINHSGEICAQALYRGQMILSKNPIVRSVLAIAVEEETDHLVWCQERINELGGHVSYLNIFWYTNAFLIGLLIGLSGDSLSLGFVKETEKQVEAHLASHLHKLPITDIKSQKIIEQMQKDEIEHGKKAKFAGAKELPYPIKKLMTIHAKVMTTLTYWI